MYHALNATAGFHPVRKYGAVFVVVDFTSGTVMKYPISLKEIILAQGKVRWVWQEGATQNYRCTNGKQRNGKGTESNYQKQAAVRSTPNIPYFILHISYFACSYDIFHIPYFRTKSEDETRFDIILPFVGGDLDQQSHLARPSVTAVSFL